MIAKANGKKAVLSSPTKPPRTSVNVDHIPDSMKLEKRWLLWKWIWRQAANGGRGKWDKPPFMADGWTHAKSTDAATWITFDEAIAAYRSNSAFDGIGYALGDDWTGVDIDDCRDPDTSVISEFAGSIIASFDTYTEVSPSGTGVKIFLRGKKPQGTCANESLGLEVYSSGRYFTVTGYRLDESPEQVRHDNGSLEWLQRAYIDNLRDYDYESKQQQTSSDLTELELARQAFQHIPASHASHYGDWVRVGIAAKNVDESLRDDWVAWSRGGSGYSSDEDCLAKWAKLTPNGKLGIGTLMHLALATGWRPERPAQASSDRTSKNTDQPKQGDPKPKRDLNIVPAAKLCTDYQYMKEPLIFGLLRFGEIINVIAPSKFGKTWLVLGLAICVAMGVEWLGFRTKACRVLLVDNELHKETIADRLRRVCKAMGLNGIPSNIDILSVRGENWNITELALEIGESFKDRYGLIILDALYRFLPDKTNENANADMTKVYNTLDCIARLNDCAIALIHHSSKGDQSGKESVDVGAGAGAITRATDSHLILRRHELDECAVLDLDARSWPKLEPMTIQMEFPLWTAKCIEPALKQGKTTRDVKQESTDRETKAKIFDLLKNGPLTKSQIRTRTGFGEQRANRGLVLLSDEGQAELKRVRNKRTGKRFDMWFCTADCTADCPDKSRVL